MIRVLRVDAEDWADEIKAAAEGLVSEPEPSDETFIATVSGAFAGFGLVRKSSFVPGAAYLSSAVVVPDFRGMRLHLRLINARVRWAKDCGLDRVYTYTLCDNHRSANSLIRCDFRVMRNPPAGLSGVVYWEREL